MPETSLSRQLLLAEPQLHIQLLIALLNLLFWLSTWALWTRFVPPVLMRCAFYRELYVGHNTACWRQLPPGPVQRGGFDTQYGYLVWSWIGVHHLVAGTLIFYSYFAEDGGVGFRHGALMDLGGVDVLQILQMVLRWPPYHEYLKPGEKDMMPVWAAHHLFGIIAVLPANLLLSTDKDAQLVAISALFVAFANIVLPLLGEVYDPLKKCNRPRKRFCFTVYLLLFHTTYFLFLYFRWYIFPIAGVNAATKLYRIHPALGIFVGSSLTLLAVFNVMVLVVSTPACLKLLMAIPSVIRGDDSDGGDGGMVEVTRQVSGTHAGHVTMGAHGHVGALLRAACFGARLHHRASASHHDLAVDGYNGEVPVEKSKLPSVDKSKVL